MFPLDFPLRILKRRARRGQKVLDPFCGRGTTGFAARLLGLDSFSLDSSPIATAITSAKLAHTSPTEIISEAEFILANYTPSEIPESEFWSLAYEPNVLKSLCCFRNAFLDDCQSDVRIALRGIILGALHGPKQKTFPSYFSNQCPRTYAPKPDYSVRFWRERNLLPDAVNFLSIIERRANRYYSSLPNVKGHVNLADSRTLESFYPSTNSGQFNWVITSPPYYGMRTYIPDQWLRNWFLGGIDYVDYSVKGQVLHSSPNAFVNDLRTVWQNVSKVCTDDAKMIIRFGGLADRKTDPLNLIKSSIENSCWAYKMKQKAGSAYQGKRQADTFLIDSSNPIQEYDIWLVRS